MRTALLLTFLIFSGCQIFESSDTDTINPDLLGDWYSIDTVSASAFSPANVRVTGWSISADGEIRSIGVMDSTGELAAFDSDSGLRKRILESTNGTILLEYTGHPDLTELEAEYRVTTDSLIVKHGSGFTNRTFQRAQLGNVVVAPKPSKLSVDIDGSSAENLKIAHTIPTAFVSAVSESELKLFAELGSRSIVIRIENFTGTRTYIIGKEQAELRIVASDWIRVFQTLSDSSGTISIDCDSVASRCVGAFEFSTKIPENDADSSPVLENGSFDVPLFD
ncbi:MAG: hypothetical protein LAT67_14050 [Balneolales bacterium]|nr:hypothetical protein [Balneolales bacterium]